MAVGTRSEIKRSLSRARKHTQTIHNHLFTVREHFDGQQGYEKYLRLCDMIMDLNVALDDSLNDFDRMI